LGRAREGVRQGGFRAPGARRGVARSVVAYNGDSMVGRRWATCGRPTAKWKAARTGASGLWPRGTGLSLHARVTCPRGTVVAVWASDRWTLRRLGVRAARVRRADVAVAR
jgi:hypothetical protein